MPEVRYQRADSSTNCTPASDANEPLLTTQTGGGDSISITVPTQTMISLMISFTTASGDPGAPGPSGLYRCQLDVTAAGASLSYYLAFHGVEADCTNVGGTRMDESDFTGTGLKLGTTTDPTGPDNINARRLQIRIFVTHSGGHGDPSETLTLRTNNSDAWFEWPGAALPEFPYSDQTAQPRRPRPVVAPVLRPAWGRIARPTTAQCAMINAQRRTHECQPMR